MPSPNKRHFRSIAPKENIMQGTIQNMASATNQGLILGDDGAYYTFTPLGWRDQTVAAAYGMRVDFEVRGFHAVGIYPLAPLPGAVPSPYANQGPTPGTFQPPTAVPSPYANPNYAPGAVQAPTARTTPPNPVQPPAARTTPATATWASQNRTLIGVLLAIVVIGVAAVGGYLFLQGQRTDEQIAAAVAEDWSNSSIDDISEVIMGMLVGQAPIVTQMGGDILADKIRDKITWNYSEPRCPQENRCAVTATASADLDIAIPLVMNDTATVEMPFVLSIDTEEERVTDWEAVVVSASVSGIRLGDVGQSVGQTLQSSDENIRRAVQKMQAFSAEKDLDATVEDTADSLRRFVEDEDVQRAVEDTADRMRDFARDEDVRRTVEDTADRMRDFADDEDVRRTVEDTAGEVQRGIQGLFGN